MNYSLTNYITDVPTARELLDSEPKQADEYNSGAVQPADLQSPRLSCRAQYGTQVRNGVLYFVLPFITELEHTEGEKAERGRDKPV